MLTSCSVKFYVRPDRVKNNGLLPIWVRVYVNGEVINLFTYYFVPENSKWDAKRGRVKGAARQDNYVNIKLANIEKRVFELRDEMERAGKHFAVADARAMLKDGSQPNEITFTEFFKKRIEKMRLNPQEWSSTVVVQYQTTLAHFMAYLKSIGHLNLSIKEVSVSHLQGFEDFLLTEYVNPKLGRKMKMSTSNRYLAKTKAILNAAVRAGAISRNPFQLGFKLKATKTNREALTMEEIETIANHSLGGNLSLDRARDLLLWEIYTGIRWGDGQLLRDEHIKFDAKTQRYWVLLKMKKTGEILELPLFREAVRVYEKYEKYRKASGFILPRLSNQKTNSYLRTICELVGITKKATSHIGRHTFATTVLQQSAEITDLATISKLLGHKSLSATTVYARVSRQLLVKVAEKVDKQQPAVKPNICLN